MNHCGRLRSGVQPASIACRARAQAKWTHASVEVDRTTSAHARDSRKFPPSRFPRGDPERVDLADECRRFLLIRTTEPQNRRAYANGE